VAVAVLLLAGCTTHSTLPPGINSQIEPSSPPHVTLRISADVTSQTVDPNAKMVPVSEVEIGWFDSQGNEIETDNVSLPVIGLAPGRTVSTNAGSVPPGAASCRALGWG